MRPDIRENMLGIVLGQGQVVQGVYPSVGEDFVPFHYTIGNAVRDLPELLVISGLRRDIAMMLLNTVGEMLRERGKPLDEGLLDIGWNFPVKVRNAGTSVRDEYTAQAGEFALHENYSVQQIMICDRDGRFPGDPGCELEVAMP